MSEPSMCYWSVADGSYAQIMTTCIMSARRVGVATDFHVWTDRSIPGAVCHSSGSYEHRNYLFKFDFLLKAAELPYEYLVFLDADNFFVRHPGRLLDQTRDAPIHVCLESDCTQPNNVRPDWWGCPLSRYVQLMRDCGVLSRSVFNTNAGFWIVHRDVARRFVDLAMEFWEYCNRQGFPFTEEAPLAYVGHMLLGNPYAHTLAMNREIWASDWIGVFADRLPDGSSWNFTDYMSGDNIPVQSAIVHCMRSKKAMVAAASPIRKWPTY